MSGGKSSRSKSQKSKSPISSSPKIKSPKKTKSLTVPKSNANDDNVFNRTRYNIMDPVYIRRRDNIILYVESIHVYEIWNRFPIDTLNCNTNDNASKGSPKQKLKKAEVLEASIANTNSNPDCEKAVISGLVAVKKEYLLNGYEIFIEIIASFNYNIYSKTPPFPDQVTIKHECFRDIIQLYPVTNTKSIVSTFSLETLSIKVKNNFGNKYKGLPFSFNLTGKPDSVFFNRPYYKDFSNGLFWYFRTYLVNGENRIPLPENCIKMKFYKYTILHAPPLLNPQKINNLNYTRYSTANDVGNLTLQAETDRAIYYHGEDIIVKINIQNDSVRHIVNEVIIFIEQNVEICTQLPQNIRIQIGEKILKSGEFALPIKPKQKWTKDVTIKPEFNAKDFNLMIDGKMDSDEKVFLASSTYELLNKTYDILKPKPKKVITLDNVCQDDNFDKSDEQLNPLETNLQTYSTNLNNLKEKQIHPVIISYDVVVRVNLNTMDDKESGHPMIRIPFLLTRETPFIDKLSTPKPPTWNYIKPH